MDWHAPPWTIHGSVRHADIIQFVVRTISVQLQPPPSDYTSSDIADVVILATLFRSAFRVRKKQLLVFLQLWPTTPDAYLHLQRLADEFVITIFFQTYCNKQTWQITRVLNYVIWHKGPRWADDFTIANHRFCSTQQSHFTSRIDLQKLIRASLDVKRTNEKDSLWHAIRNLGMVLSPVTLLWSTFDGLRMPANEFETLDRLTLPTCIGSMDMTIIGIVLSLEQIQPSSNERHYTTLPELEHDPRDGDAMLAVRSPSWPEICPQFCLFILSANYPDHTNDLHDLLQNTITLGNFYKEDDRQLSPSDLKTLRNWRTALKQTS